MASDPVLAEQHHYKRHMPSVATVVNPSAQVVVLSLGLTI